MSERPPKRQPLAVYRLLNAGPRTRQPLNEIVVKDDGVVPLNVVLPEGLEGRAFVRTTEPDFPKWKGFLEPAIETIEAALQQHAANSLLLVVKKGLSRYALAFGHARSLIEPHFIERGFGLRCALAVIDEGSLSSADYKQVDHTTLFARVQANKPVSFDEFRIDTEASLLGGIVGRPAEAHRYYTRILGADPLHLNPAITIHQLPDLLDWVESIRKQREYVKRGFDFIDHISEVRDPSVEAQLRSKIDQQLASTARVGVGVPELLEPLLIESFKVTGLRKEELQTITLEDIFRSLGKRAKTCDDLKTRRIRGLDGDGNVVKHWPAFDWLVWSGKHKGSSFHLQHGRFYEVQEKYENRIDRFLRTLDPLLPAWPDITAKNEDQWNKKLHKRLGSKKSTLMDKKMIHKTFRGPSSIEFCDVYTRGTPNWLVCAKIYKGSAPLSHLFAQGANAIETFFADEDFRKELREQPGLKSSIKLRVPKKDEFGVAYVILCEKKVRALTSLPFFAKLTLFRYAKVLKSQGIAIRVGLRSMA